MMCVFILVMLHLFIYLILSVIVCVLHRAEVGNFADAVSLPGPEVLSDAGKPQTKISAGDEDEGVPNQHTWYETDFDSVTATLTHEEV